MLCFRANGKKLVETHSSLPRLRPGWALVRVRMAGICNTDLEILHGYHNFRGTPGHEFVGEVQEVGGVSAAVEKRWIGKRVNGEINIPCHALGFRSECRFCKRSLTRHCERRKVLGIVAHDGALPNT
jgi:threonine dehydrogenase-like Zn-dependent dehydrogenase